MMGKVTDTRSRGKAGRRKGPSKANSPRASRDSLSPAGAKIVAAFEEAIEITRSGRAPERRLTARTYQVDFTPHDYCPDDVRRIRGLLGMSQVLFARFLGVDANTVRSWEQGNRPPSAIARRFMDEVGADPDYWRTRIARRAIGVETSKASD